jgi:hypothetical protein
MQPAFGDGVGKKVLYIYNYSTRITKNTERIGASYEPTNRFSSAKRERLYLTRRWLELDGLAVIRYRARENAHG